jgi:23S rRNA pseudouridine1911/1915/1917 synthase
MIEPNLDNDIDNEEESTEQELFEHFRMVVDKGQSLLRIDKYLMHRLQNASRTKIQAAADNDCIVVNDRAVKSSYKVKPGDVITIVLPHPPKDTEIVPEDIPLEIVYEDDDLLLVNKHAGMVVHPGYNNVSGTLVNALAWHFKDLPFAKDNNIRPGLVHRIDKNTSGLLIIAKNEHAMTHLAKQFYVHSIERAYVALAWGNLEHDEGTISGYIGRSPKDRKIFQLYTDEQKGKWSVTHYKVLERLENVTLIECRLETGRTHQIRVHMQNIGHPLFGDSTYGGDSIRKGTVTAKYKQFVENCIELCPRQALHARLLGFKHPKQNKAMRFEMPIPTDMQALIDKWRGYHKYVLNKEE